MKLQAQSPTVQSSALPTKKTDLGVDLQGQSSPGNPPTNPDSFEVQPTSRSSAGFSVVKSLKVGVPIAAGLYAGLATGRWAGVAGAVALTPALALTGVIGGAYVGERLLHQSDGHQLSSVAIGAGAGLLTGITTGYLLGSRVSHPVLAVGLALVGGATSAILGKLKS